MNFCSQSETAAAVLCPAGCMMAISSQQLHNSSQAPLFFCAVCGFVNRFAVFVSHSFHFFHFVFVFVLSVDVVVVVVAVVVVVVLYLYFLQFFALGF